MSNYSFIYMCMGIIKEADNEEIAKEESLKYVSSSLSRENLVIEKIGTQGMTIINKENGEENK